MDWYLQVLRKYAVFSGRARRKEYWMFVLVHIIISIVIFIIGSFAYGLYGLAIIIPAFAVAIRRLHDTGRSGWWLLVNCVPIIGWTILFIWLVKDSDEGENQYGPNPKEALVPSQ
jgi:uncharacterized membrane protein YhaH (DUF805 family)|tara:strand:- start:7 stop:351 length:345 start_codon:yes stop_codon:yes gene_type:complete